jgi:uncharacterized protein (DUF4213/DUF364 family)
VTSQVVGREVAPRADEALPSHDIYRDLVADIPLGLPVTSCVAGLVWTLVEAGGHGGLGITLQDGVYESVLPGRIGGVEARWLAERIVSWNMFEASLGLAAVNSWHNRRDKLEELLQRPLVDDRGSPLFERLSRRFEGGSVAVVGHFPHLGPLRRRCRLTILERRPSPGDLPDQASEYVLGNQDCVCITGSAVVNKTLPRLLELSGSAYVALIGPSVPLAPLLFDYGVDLLAGAVVLDHEGAVGAVQQGARRSLFGDCLAKVELEAESYRTSFRGTLQA